MKKYLIRLDDACPTMDHAKWQRMFNILDKYVVRPMVGIIPNNKDPKQEIDTLDPEFWEKVNKWRAKGYALALHGYDHCYISNDGMKGLNPLWERSEFSGVSLEKQKEKIREGVKIFRDHGIDPQYFFAPSHTFDSNTLRALKEESNIRIISDTIASTPYKYGDFVIIPQLGGHCREMKLPGIWTFCLHPSTMEDEDFVKLEKFLMGHKEEIIGFLDIDYSNVGSKDIVSRILACIYFIRRKLKGLK